MSENSFKKINKIAITTLIFCNFIKAESLNKTDDNELLWERYLKEQEYKLVLKKIDQKKVFNSLPEYKRVESEYKKYIEDQQKQLADKAEVIKKESEELEKKWTEKKIELQKIKDQEEYAEEYKTEENNYNNKKTILEEKYRILMGEQNTMENDARIKRNELFNPIEKKVTKMIDEYTTILSEKISEIRKKNNKKPVKIIVLYSDIIANSNVYLKSNKNLDITESVIIFIKNKNTQYFEKTGNNTKVNITDKKNNSSVMKKYFHILIFPILGLFIAGYMGIEKYKNWEKQKLNDLYLAVFQFEKENYKEALMGDDTFMGFFEFLNKYRNNSISDICKLYIGICLVKIKDYKNGIDYLKEVKIKEPIIKAKCLAFIANAFVELKEYQKAIDYFLKASKCFKNDIDNPDFILNAVLCFEKLEKYNNALELVEQTLKEYTNTKKHEVLINKKNQLLNKIYNKKLLK